MPDLYPLFLDVAGRPCLVVGAGRVAERKVGGLLAAGARVTVVAPEGTRQIEAWADREEIRWLRRPFESSDVAGTCLAFVATTDPQVNRLAAQAAKQRGTWVNVADDPEASDFHVPAVLRKGPVAAAVSTSGSSPALAGWVRDRVADALPRGTEPLSRVLGTLREITPREGTEGAKAHRALLDAGLGDDLARGDWKAADEKVSRFYDSAPGVAEILSRRLAETR